MNNCIIKIEKDNECDDFYFLDINDNEGNKLARFSIDIGEVCDHTTSFRNFKNLSINDKYNIFNVFVNDLTQKKTKIALNFIMENGERSISVNNNIMRFCISSMTISCEFNVIITEQLINEFQKIELV